MDNGARPSGLPPLHEAWLPREHALHRPRHGGRQFTALVCALVFFVPPGISLVFGAEAEEIENHKLAEFPSPGEGWGFLTGMSRWATDHLVFRGGSVRAADAISRGVFGEPAPFDQGETRQPNLLPGTDQQQDRTYNDPGTYPKVVDGTEGWIYLGLDIGSKCRSALAIGDTIDRMRKLRTAVEASGRKLVYVVAPDKSTAKPEFLPTNFLEDECWRQQTNLFWQRVPKETGAIDLRPSIREVEKTFSVYFKEDAHWADEGGLLLTRELAEKIQSGVTRDWVTRPGTSWTGKSDIPPLIGRESDKSGIHYQLAPDGGADQASREPTSDYDKTVVRLRSQATSGVVTGKVGWLGDSFTPYSERYLGAAFQDISITHYQRITADADAVIGMLADQEVVVVEVAERGLASGASPFLTPEFIDRLGSELARKPVR